MLNLTPEECETKITAVYSEYRGLVKELLELKEEQGRLNAKKERLENNIFLKEKKRDALRRAKILIQPLPKKLMALRKSLLHKMARVESKQITIATEQKLWDEIRQLKKDLPKSCSHAFVFDIQGYGGSYSNDFDDKYPGRRYCVVCGFDEETYKTRDADRLGLSKEYIYETLTPSDNRIVQREPYRQGLERTQLNIWVPLGTILYQFEGSVVIDLNK